MLLRTFGVLWLVLIVVSQLASRAAAETPAAVVLSRQGQAALPIVVGELRSLEAISMFAGQDLQAIDLAQADPELRVERAVGALVQYLGHMSGAGFSSQHGTGEQGIAVGLFTDFPELQLSDRFDPADSLRQEEYLLRSHTHGLQIIAVSELALENAIWDLLYRLGYRQYFPGRLWEFVPQLDAVVIEVDSFERPDFHSRLIWYGGGAQEHTRVDYQHWIQRNRAVAGLRVNTSHEYGRIQSRNKEAFAANPEYYALVGGERKSGWHAKFNVTHPGLRQLVVDDAIQWFRDNPGELSKSMDPSDFGGWDESDEAKTIGSPTDQALTLANLVAEATSDHFGTDRYVGMYSYFQHQTAPTRVQPHRNVIISFATRFLFSGRTVETLIADWREAGTRLAGIREYYGCHYFDRGQPLRSVQGASLDYIRTSIPDFHRHNALFFTAESSDEWGMLGLGHYIAARLLWDVSEADRVEERVAEFLQQMFGPAAEPMGSFYRLLNGEDRPQLTDRRSTGQLYRFLADARQRAASASESVKERIDALILYVRFVELFGDYLQSEGEQAQALYEQAIRLAYRTRHYQLASINGYINGTYRNAVPAVHIPSNARWNIPEDRNPWKSSEPVTEQEVLAVLEVANKRYGTPVLEKKLPEVSLASTATAGNSVPVRFIAGDYRVTADAGEPIAITFHTRIMNIGVGPAYQVFSPSGKIIRHGRVEVTGPYELAWQAEEAGTYRILMEAHYNAARYVTANRVRFEARNRYEVSGTVNLVTPRGTLYFWVPAGEEPLPITVAGQGGESVRAWLIGPDGKVLEEKDQITGHEPHVFMIPAEARTQGAAWGVRFNRASTGPFEDVFLTLPAQVPAWMSTDPAGLVETKP